MQLCHNVILPRSFSRPADTILSLHLSRGFIYLPMHENTVTLPYEWTLLSPSNDFQNAYKSGIMKGLLLCQHKKLRVFDINWNALWSLQDYFCHKRTFFSVLLSISTCTYTRLCNIPIYFHHEPYGGHDFPVLIYPWWRKQPQETEGYTPEQKKNIFFSTIDVCFQ